VTGEPDIMPEEATYGILYEILMASQNNETDRKPREMDDRKWQVLREEMTTNRDDSMVKWDPNDGEKST
jgi:hypothetical protein